MSVLLQTLRADPGQILTIARGLHQAGALRILPQPTWEHGKGNARMPDYPDWRLRKLLGDLPKNADLLFEAASLYWPFFDHVVERLMHAPIVPPEDFVHDTKGFGGFAPGDVPPGEPTKQHHRCVFLAALAFIRTLTRSGLLAFCGMPSETLGLHRRTLESLVDIELLVDRPHLAPAYEAHATEGDRAVRRQNLFHNASHNLNSEIKDPNPRRPIDTFTPLQCELRKRGQFGYLDAGPHSGMFHAAMGFREDVFCFLDPRSWLIAMLTYRCAWEAFQLCDALVPKLAWIDGAKWDATAANVQEQARVIERHINESNQWSGPLPPWSSFQPLPSKSRRQST